LQKDTQKHADSATACQKASKNLPPPQKRMCNEPQARITMPTLQKAGKKLAKPCARCRKHPKSPRKTFPRCKMLTKSMQKRIPMLQKLEKRHAKTCRCCKNDVIASSPSRGTWNLEFETRDLNDET
jgi:hypothetical protein